MFKKSRISVILALATLSSPALLPLRADAMTAEMCQRYGAHCVKKCEQRPIGKDVCIKRCVRAESLCIINSSSTTTGQNAPSTPDPLHPKGGNPGMPPTGGTKNEPKPPPKVNDTRPPMGGGVFQPKTSGGGIEGPILHSSGNDGHSGGTPGPILKSNGGGGPSFRSNGQR